MVQRFTYAQKRENVLANGYVPGMRVTWLGRRAGKERIAATIVTVTHRAQVIIRLDVAALGLAIGTGKRVEPFALRPGWPVLSPTDGRSEEQ